MLDIFQEPTLFLNKILSNHCRKWLILCRSQNTIKNCYENIQGHI